MFSKGMRKSLIGLALFSVGTFLHQTAAVAQDEGSRASDIAPGTVVSKANLDSIGNKGFEGHGLKDLLTHQMETRIRRDNLKMVLQSKKRIPRDPRWVQASRERNRPVALDTVSGMIDGYIAGDPFPQISQDDPDAGVKLLWNANYSWQQYDNFTCTVMTAFIDGDIGIEQMQRWTIDRYFFTGRVSDRETHFDPAIFHKTLLFASYPQDIRGTGVFAIRYNTGELDDRWAYIRTVRRVRRLSGGAWVDPIGGTDQLQDDVGIINAHPTWYSEAKLLGIRSVLVSTNSPFPWKGWQATDAATFPRLDLTVAPYWDTTEVWEPREVYVVELIPPEYHPYGKKVIYMGVDNFLPYQGDAYDKKGDHWKWLQHGFAAVETDDGYIDGNGNRAIVEFQSWGLFIDFPRRHASYLATDESSCHINSPVKKPEDYAASRLETIGR